MIIAWNAFFIRLYTNVLDEDLANAWDSTVRFALFALFAREALLAGIVKAATRKACNESKTLGQLGLVCV